MQAPTSILTLCKLSASTDGLGFMNLPSILRDGKIDPEMLEQLKPSADSYAKSYAETMLIGLYPIAYDGEFFEVNGQQYATWLAERVGKTIYLICCSTIGEARHNMWYERSSIDRVKEFIRKPGVYLHQGYSGLKKLKI